MSDLHVTQHPTGIQIKQNPEFFVTIFNNCSCAQKNVKLECLNFQTVEPINPSILSVSGDVCLVNGGQPIASGDVSVTFKYAWPHTFPLNPISSDSVC